jgi:hypothetical protein
VNTNKKSVIKDKKLKKDKREKIYLLTSTIHPVLKQKKNNFIV